MRMLLKCSVLAMSAAGILAAQHGGGGGGHHGGGGSGGGGFHASPSHSNSAPSHSAGSGYHLTSPAPIGLQPYASGYSGINPGAYGNNYRPAWPSAPGTVAHPVMSYPPARRPIRPVRPVRSGYYGFGYYPALGFGYYSNDWYDPYYESGPVPYAPEQYAPYAADEPQPYPAYSAMSVPNADYSPVPYAPGNGPMVQPAAPVDEPAEAAAPPIMIVLKTGQKWQVENFAIMNGEFWDFTKVRSRRIPLADIDVTASAKATDEAGGVFPVESFSANPK